MSVENLKEYARRCAADPVLREKAKAIGASNVDEQIVHATALGLPWTRIDLDAFRKEMEAEGELSEEDLEQVAGGLVTSTAAAVVGAAAGVVSAGAAVASTTSGSGW
jgi:predicted ribosomally synthesized peptide with nif11-like leader